MNETKLLAMDPPAQGATGQLGPQCLHKDPRRRGRPNFQADVQQTPPPNVKRAQQRHWMKTYRAPRSTHPLPAGAQAPSSGPSESQTARRYQEQGKLASLGIHRHRAGVAMEGLRQKVVPVLLTRSAGGSGRRQGKCR